MFRIQENEFENKPPQIFYPAFKPPSTHYKKRITHREGYKPVILRTVYAYG